MRNGNGSLKALVLEAFDASGWGFSHSWVHYKAIVRVVNAMLRDSGQSLVRASVIERVVRKLVEEGFLVGNGKGFFQQVRNHAHYFARSVKPKWRCCSVKENVNGKEFEGKEEESKGEWTEVKGGNVFSFDKEGDSVEGKLVDVRTEQGKFKSTVYDIEVGDGSLVSVFGSVVLDGRLKRVSIGETVKIVFLGTRKSSSGREYADFQVFVKKQTEESQ